MDILFNFPEDTGQNEITELLGFLSDDFSFDRMKTDLELNTPELLNFISEPVYLKIVEYYQKTNKTDADKTKFSEILKKSQLFISIISYHDFAGNNDLLHTTEGRKIHNSSNEKTAWDWQIAADNATLKKKAYKALDQLIIELDKSKLNEWLESDSYKKSKSILVNKTSAFNDLYPINNSEQLFYRLIPFMVNIEALEISSRIPNDIYKKLQAANLSNDLSGLSNLETSLLIFCKNALVYLTLAKAYKVFPIEMFADKINYKETTRMRSQARAEVMLYLKEEGKSYLLDVESSVKQIQDLASQNTSIEEQNPLPGLETGNKHVDI